MPPDWRFLQDEGNLPDASWSTHTSQAFAGLERINRMRASMDAAVEARLRSRDGEKVLLVSHLPNMAIATNMSRKMLRTKVPQIAFSFNFTTLPKNSFRYLYRLSLRGIDEFVVFSSFERDLYADWFGIPSDKIRFIKWAMNAPSVAPSAVGGTTQPPYLCSIGGEARDYRLIAETMRRLPQYRAVIIARPYSVAGIEFPDNVDVRLNLPGPETWRIAMDSVGMALPLLTRSTACGHITFAAGQLLGIPMVVTDTLGLADYISDVGVFRTVEPGHIDAMVSAVEALFAETDQARNEASAIRSVAERTYSLSHWTTYFTSVLKGL
ncbi:hypothetical protein J7394_21270 [Ruegeria sp. R13_0]|uniref:hypothetical protein n=1 Tax=Ruegeria sp. R13_0 TaxID=2821099 RepID=UPI001ADAF9DA|nr:hypothetical protein [Ruegeria sp. R13_0]MBO9436747.1 hypothetical protein [Ruegeria sp. R13_0]